MPKHKHADLIKAWADGAEIEYLNPFENEWVRTSNPAWYETTEYRIKPEPKPEREYIQNHLEHWFEGVWCAGVGGQRVKWTIDGETSRIKSIELLDK